MALLRCPLCKGALKLRDEKLEGGRICFGTLECESCAQTYSIEDGIARLLPARLVTPTDEAEEEIRLKRSEMAARNAQVRHYDAMKLMRLYARYELPTVIRALRPQPSSIILEAGCGTGRMTPQLASNSRLLIAIDFSIDSLKACKAKVDRAGRQNCCLLQADVCALPFAEATFDQVVSHAVLAHVPTAESRSSMVKELARVAKNGSKVVISAYQHSLFTRLFDKREGLHKGGIYYYRFSRKELKELLSKHFSVKRLTGSLVYYFLAKCERPGDRSSIN